MACNRLTLLSNSLVGVDSNDAVNVFLLPMVGESNTEAAG